MALKCLNMTIGMSVSKQVSLVVHSDRPVIEERVPELIHQK